MTITNGICEYTTPRPWDAASARVTLAFQVAPDEDAETVTGEVGEMAKRRAIAMLAGTVAAPATPVVSGYKDPGPTTWTGPTVDQAMKNMVDIMGSGGAPANPTTTLPATPPVDEQSASAAVIADTAPEPEKITDQRLLDEVTARNAALLTAAGQDDLKRQLVPASIHRLIGGYTDMPPGRGRLSSVPQEKRQALLDALRGLS